MTNRKKKNSPQKRPVATANNKSAQPVSELTDKSCPAGKDLSSVCKILPQTHKLHSKLSVLILAKRFEPLVNVVAGIAMVGVAGFSCQVSNSQKNTSKKQGEIQLLINTQSSQSATAFANYSEIRDILLASNSSPHGQIFALQRFAEVMKAQVDELGPKEKRTVYPNVKPMRTLIHQFLRAERNPQQSVYSRPLASVSNELIKLLSKLGSKSRSSACPAIWNLVSISSQETKDGPEVRPSSLTTKFDLSYLKPEFFVGSQLPYLFQFKGSPEIVFPEGADFGSANFYHSNLSGCSFKHASFRSADLRSANFNKADLTGANFSGADLTGATFEDAQIEGANFEGAVGFEAPKSAKNGSQ